MSQVDSTNTASNILSHLNIGNKQPERKSNELGQSAFLELMITQLTHQDPLSPQDNTEFVAQLAQFSSVEGLERLNKNFDGFTNHFRSNQALQASLLVGRSVSIPTDSSLLLPDGIISGSVELESSAPDFRINIYDGSNSLVAQIPVGYQAEGEVVFRWDGMFVEVNGNLLDWAAGEEGFPPGKYRFEILATQDGEVQQLETALSANVNSVTLDAEGALILNLAGVGAVDIADIKQFN